MPRFDRTGPAGMGPMTGWGRGLCGASGGRRASGAGFGWGGRGRGWRHSAGFSEWGRGRFGGPYYGPSYARQDEMAALKEEAASLKEELTAVEQRLSELESSRPDRE